MKTFDQIADMKLRLSQLPPALERFNKHGESNWEALHCQLAVLEHKLTEDDCWNQWPTHHQGQDLFNREKAMEAVRWLWEDGRGLVELWSLPKLDKVVVDTLEDDDNEHGYFEIMNPKRLEE